MLFILSHYNFSIGKPISFIESTIFIWRKIWVIAIRWLIDTFPLVGEANSKVDIFYNWTLEWSCETVHVCSANVYFSWGPMIQIWLLFPAIGRTVEPAKLPPVINYFTIYATAKGHPHKYVIYSQPKVNIAESIENCVHFKLFQQSGLNNKLYSIIGSLRIHQGPEMWNHELVNFPVRQRKKCKILDDQEDT